MLIIALCIIGILSLTEVLSTLHYKKIDKNVFVIITGYGLLMNKELHFWKGVGGAIRIVGYCAEDPFMIEINYNIWYYRRAQSICTVVVPIPKGEEETAAKVIEELSENIRR